MWVEMKPKVVMYWVLMSGRVTKDMVMENLVMMDVVMKVTVVKKVVK